ncbi:hypothetical protein EAF04_000621 [Stromatinia cepivora]|nr:hypothetical protein EAF04_000621 [Stromatinia cepivora]
MVVLASKELRRKTWLQQEDPTSFGTFYYGRRSSREPYCTVLAPPRTQKPEEKEKAKKLSPSRQSTLAKKLSREPQIMCLRASVGRLTKKVTRASSSLQQSIYTVAYILTVDVRSVLSCAFTKIIFLEGLNIKYLMSFDYLYIVRYLVINGTLSSFTITLLTISKQRNEVEVSISTRSE